MASRTIISEKWPESHITQIQPYSKEETDNKIIEVLSIVTEKQGKTIEILESVSKRQINTETKYSKLYRKKIWKKQRSKFKSGWAK